MDVIKTLRSIHRLREFGGFRLIKAYVRIGVLRSVLKESLKGLVLRKSFRDIYHALQPVIVTALQKEYEPLMKKQLSYYSNNSDVNKRSNYIWFCWLQGIEAAPQIVIICLKSLRRYLPEKEIIIVDNNNRHDYVSLPDYIEKKWEKKQITSAHFSDLLRLELLIKYGGTWIDSTVLCTGENYMAGCLDSDLFVFQFKKDKNAQYAGISNWFVTSCQNNNILMTLRDMLFAYWKDYDCVLEYYIYHRFFDMIAIEMQDEIKKIPYAYSTNSLVLGHNWGRTFQQETWEKLVSMVSFHKLTYKVEDSVLKDNNNYYNFIIRNFNAE